MTTDWREGHRILEERIASIPERLRRAARDPDPEIDARGARAIVATGVGSSAAHAKFLVHVLSEELGVRARFAPLSSFLAPPGPGAEQDVLVLFSQGLSPNARIALRHAESWKEVVVATAVESDEELSRHGARVIRFPGDGERGTLVRVIGPMTGYVAALRIACGLGHASVGFELNVETICHRIERADRACPLLDAGVLEANLAFLAGGSDAELLENLRYKVLEGMLLPSPPIWDFLTFAHGPFQRSFSRPATFLAFTRRGVGCADEVLSRIASMLDPELQRLVRLEATLPGPLAIFEWEALGNRLLLRYVAERKIDQVSWPGRGRDARLYEFRGAPRPPRLEDLTWPEVERHLAEGRRTVTVALGSNEQHGPHLPLATDTWIAEALAERFCARVDEAIQGPTIAIGCSPEHMAFPGTVSLRDSTLEALLADVLGSLARHGFERAFVFSAHGGNYQALRAALPGLREAASPMRVLAFTDAEALTRIFHGESQAFGVSPEASGHHAGEFETSILEALRPGDVRRNRRSPGLVEPGTDPQSVFYPSLRDKAPSGVVGDPTAAAAERAEAYLDAWAAALAEAYRRDKNRRWMNGV